jgi:hypothetical protein
VCNCKETGHFTQNVCNCKKCKINVCKRNLLIFKKIYIYNMYIFVRVSVIPLFGRENVAKVEIFG